MLLPQVSRRHADVPAVQQGLDQREDLRAASPPGPAGGEVKALRGQMEGLKEGWRGLGVGVDIIFTFCNLCLKKFDRLVLRSF